MSLHTKSIQKPVAKKDGVRICVMRRPKEGMNWDIHMPALSPSHQLLDDYLYHGATWDEYVVRFTEEVLQADNESLQILGEMAKQHRVTILCWEKEPHQCHRRLVAEYCQKKYPDLEIVVK